MNLIRRNAVLGCGLVVLLVALTQPRWTGAAAAPSVLTYAMLSTGTSKIPAFTTTGEDALILDQIYEALLSVDPTTFKISPHLATSYTVSQDGKTWTFKLRRGVHWQRGYGEFTCADVQFTWDLHKNPANNSFWQTNAKIVDSVTCPDAYTAVIKLNTPFQGFIWNLVDMEPSTGWVLSKAAWDKLGREGYEKTPVGTGPFMLQSITPGQDVIIVRNPDYWGPKAGLDQIDFKAISDSQTAALGVKSGAVDIATSYQSLDPVTAVQYQNTPGVKLIRRPSFSTSYLEINTTVKPFDDVRVRQAMRYAIDYKGLITSVMHGFATPGLAGMMLKGMIGFDGSVNPENTYDVNKAKELLKEAGIALPVHGFFTTYNDTKDINSAQFIAASLSQIGIQLEARPLERGTLVQERIKPTTPASILGTSVSPDPDFLFSLSFISAVIPPAGLNIARYNGIDQLYDSQHSAPALADRVKYLKQIQAKLAADVPAIELWQEDFLALINDRVEHFVPTVLFNGDPLWIVTLKAK
jgi:peptide/nickel transport system substrate-binding protein